MISTRIDVLRAAHDTGSPFLCFYGNNAIRYTFTISYFEYILVLKNRESVLNSRLIYIQVSKYNGVKRVVRLVVIAAQYIYTNYK